MGKPVRQNTCIPARWVSEGRVVWAIWVGKSPKEDLPAAGPDSTVFSRPKIIKNNKMRKLDESNPPCASSLRSTFPHTCTSRSRKAFRLDKVKDKVRVKVKVAVGCILCAWVLGNRRALHGLAARRHADLRRGAALRRSGRTVVLGDKNMGRMPGWAGKDPKARFRQKPLFELTFLAVVWCEGGRGRETHACLAEPGTPPSPGGFDGGSTQTVG